MRNLTWVRPPDCLHLRDVIAHLRSPNFHAQVTLAVRQQREAVMAIFKSSQSFRERLKGTFFIYGRHQEIGWYRTVDRQKPPSAGLLPATSGLRIGLRRLIVSKDFH
ncbi:hypothetical protein Bbelb_347140 [Branchiostoma belcheri]|nr:hypothetical protein Bbelb_347140 [Branchiostoma belcheri]